MRLMATEKGMTVWSAVFITIVLFVFVKLVCLLDKVGEFDFRGDVDASWDKTPFWSLFGDGSWVPPVHNVQNTVSHVSQNSNSYKRCECLAMIWRLESSYIYMSLIENSQLNSKRELTWLWCVEHFGITSRLCLAIKSSNWLTRNDGGRAWTPPRGIVISSRHIGHRNCPVSRANVATILSKHWMQTVCEHGINFGLCSPPSYMPLRKWL